MKVVVAIDSLKGIYLLLKLVRFIKGRCLWVVYPGSRSGCSPTAEVKNGRSISQWDGGEPHVSVTGP